MIVVTGASGMLGAQIVLQAHLSGLGPIRALYRSASSLASVQISWAAQGYPQVFAAIEWRQVDLLDALETYEAIQGTQALVHAAAVVSFRKKDEPGMRKANPHMSENVWLSALDARITQGIHISSIATLSTDPRSPMVTETHEAKRSSLSAYGQSKYDAEMVAWRYAEEGVPMTVLHPSVILGPPAWQEGSSLFPKTIANGLAFVSPGATGWVDVRDVAEAVVTILGKPHPGERYILNGTNASFQTVFSQLAMGLKKNPPRWVAPRWTLALAWRLERLRERFLDSRPLLTKDSVSAACSTVTYSAEKAQLAGFHFRPLEDTTAWVTQQYFSLYS